jgi:hypothetical protein
MAAGELRMLLGWRGGTYPVFKLFADFGHFLGVSHSFCKAGRPWDVSGVGGSRHKADGVRVTV